jgi:hypothetical protein
LNVLTTSQAFDALSGDSLAGELKYLARIAGRAPLEPLHEPCYFQSARLYPWHLQFLQKFSAAGATLSFDTYRQLVVREATRRMWGGTVRRWPAVKHPLTKAAPVVTYDVYAEPNGLSVEQIVEVDQALKSCAPFAREQLLFVPNAPDQEALLRRERANLAARGVAAIFPSELLGEVSFVAYTRGESYGYLRVVPRGVPLKEYGPRDIVVVESAPQDISIVAGLLTQRPQNELGHVNLRLREKGTPNATLTDLYEAAWVAALDGQLAHLTVAADGLTITAASIEQAEAYWRAHRPEVRTPLADLTRRELAPFANLRAADARAYGAKSANLAELTHVLPPTNRPDGFAMPFVRYRDFMRDSGLAAQVEALVAAQAAGGDAAAKRSALKVLRDAIRAAQLDGGLLAELRAAIELGFGPAGLTTYLRFRSSTNVEDLDSFTGAGLYDSRSGCLADDLDGDDVGPSACLRADKRAELERQRSARSEELRLHPDRVHLVAMLDDIDDDLQNEKPAAQALLKVWASLWNERAFDERAYYGIDHRLAFMGVAVHPTYALERANAVVVSNLSVDQGLPLYRVNSQIGELSVVTPEDPGAVAEVLTFRRAQTGAELLDIQVTLGSSLLPPGSEVWPRDKLRELGALLFTVHDHFAREVYPQLSPLSLDFEVKLERNDAVVIKQVRPYLGSDL